MQRDGSTARKDDAPEAGITEHTRGGEAAPIDKPEHEDVSRLPLRIEDYGLIGDCTTAALIGREGSLDWLCWPRFDSGACFAALLGDESNGRWRMGPAVGNARSDRGYRDSTMVLETRFYDDAGDFAVIDFMPIGGKTSSVIRIVEGRRGTSKVRMSMMLRFDYGASVPWVEAIDGGIVAIAGPNLVVLRASVPMHGEHFSTIAEFDIEQGQRVDLRDELRRLASAAAGSTRCRRRTTQDGSLLARMGRPLPMQRQIRRRHAAFAAHVESAHVHRNRRHGRRADDIAARTHRRRTQLGLPLLLDSRRDAHAFIVHARGLLR